MFAFIDFLTIVAQSSLGDLSQFNGYLLLGYIVMWVIAVVYLFTLSNRQRNLQQDIRLMRRLLEEDESDHRS